MLNYTIISELYDEGKTIREIAEITQSSASTVMRLLKKNGKTLRTKSQAAKIAVEEGRLKSPTKGKKRTQREKDRIGSGRAAKWKSVDDDTRKAFKDAARKRWDALPDSDKQERQRLAGEALKAASIEGSKLEKFMYQYLTKLGYNVIMHKKGLIAGEKYEIDLYLPNEKIVIEIDGPQHFLPIFGEDRLKNTIKYDAIKNGTLVSYGLCVIRVKFLFKSFSAYIAKTISNMVLEEVKKIEKIFPPEEKRIIELETSLD